MVLKGEKCLEQAGPKGGIRCLQFIYWNSVTMTIATFFAAFYYDAKEKL